MVKSKSSANFTNFLSTNLACVLLSKVFSTLKSAIFGYKLFDGNLDYDKDRYDDNCADNNCLGFCSHDNCDHNTAAGGSDAVFRNNFCHGIHW